MQLILASGSPRRKELLSLFHIPFTVVPADVDETMDPANAPCEEVARLSAKKARAVKREPDDVVIAADTIVVCEGKVLGKPKSEENAYHMLSLLSGRDHQVMTGCTVLRGEKCETFTEVTDLHFRTLSEREILAYIASGEPMDKAGAYGIQGGAALFCRRMEGDYYNVMGLPVCRLWQTLQSIAPELTEEHS
ncbi:MAG TPA: septum formation inhibitor Maf [Candidatus Faecousia faecipullorum]|nr:septum formation inhibitor Maf [Candidatus Faecousia faecipullorum]